MIFAILSVFVAFVIAVGRQSAVFGMLERSLWFFSNFETKRIYFSLASIALGILAIFLNQNSSAIYWLFGLSVLFLLSTFVFDFKYIFPEIKTVEKKIGKEVDIPDSTQILGVELSSKALAYPLEVVMSRHIVNDKSDNTGIVACYCAICRSGLVFNSIIDGLHLYFKVAGVWRRNMIMIDDQTQSLWQQATGECIYGKMKGKQLALLSGENTTWSAWINKHPDTEYAYKCEEARKAYLSRKTMLKGLESTTSRMTPPGFSDISGLPKRETVFGINFNGISKAYPKSDLNGVTTFSDKFGVKSLELSFDEIAGYLSAKEVETNKSVIVEKHWWLGWKEFHPQTEIWKKKS
jgi:hypothetical protein